MQSIKQIKRDVILGGAFVAFLVAAPAFAFGKKTAGPVQYGEPALGGTGCAAESAKAKVIHDNTTQLDTILIEASDYRATIGFGRNLDRKTCNLALPAKIPTGYQLKVFKAEAKGSAEVNVEAHQLKISAEYIIPGGGEGQKKEYLLSGVYRGELQWKDSIPEQGIALSACGETEVNLRINTSMILNAQGGSVEQSSQATLQKIELSQIKLVPCN